MKQNSSFLTVLCVLSACLSSGLIVTATGQAAHDEAALPVEDVLSMRSFLPYASPAVSPDGKKLAFAVQDNRDENPPTEESSLRTGIPFKRADVNVIDTVTGRATVVSGGGTTNWGVSWSPDGRYLAFLSDRDRSGQAKVWIWDRSQGTVRKVSDTVVRGTEIQWLPDARRFLVTTLPQELSPEDYVNRVLRVPPRIETGSAGTTVVVLRSKPVPKQSAPPDLWNLDVFLRGVTLIDVSTGISKTLIRGKRVAEYLSSPDGQYVAYTTPKAFEKPGSQQILFDLSIVELSGGEERTLGTNLKLGPGMGSLSWSPDSRRLAFRSGGMDDPSHSCHIVDVNAGTLREAGSLPGGKPPREEMRCLWDELGKSLYFLGNGALWRTTIDDGVTAEVARIRDRAVVKTVSDAAGEIWTSDHGRSTIVIAHDSIEKEDGFYRIDLRTGEATRLLERSQCYTCVFGVDDPAVIVRDNGPVLYYSEDAQNASDIWITGRNFREQRQLTNLNPQLRGHRMGRARLIDWTSDDGIQLQGTLLLPTNYIAGQHYPLVVVVYGGEDLSDGFDRYGAWFDGPFNMQLLATRGYAVLLSDSVEHVGTPMLDLAKSVLPGINKVVGLGIADSSRVGVLGHSRGGYDTLGLLVETSRFKAAVAIDGFADLVSDYGYLDPSGAAWGTWAEHMMGGSIWGYRDRYIENSPIFYLDRIQTPLLIVHGAGDHSVPSFLSDELFVGLRRLGKEVEYAKYQGEGHSPNGWSYANQTDLCNRMIRWFDQHLKGVGN